VSWTRNLEQRQNSTSSGASSSFFDRFNHSRHFLRNHFRSESFKSKITSLLTAEGENWIGCGMTYTLFECLKEQLTELLDELEEEIKTAKLNAVTENVRAMKLAPVISTGPDTPAAKKEQLTKSQKRRMWERTDNKGQRQRGWNWMCLIRHLSQTGSSKDDDITPAVTVAH
jgi:hypothetical protein